MTQPCLSVIIPVYNQWPLTERCLHSLAETSRGIDCEVIVVDNGSSDETASALDAVGACLFSSFFSAIHLPENRNFGPACTLGALRARSERLFFLNNDTLLIENCLTPLIEALESDAQLGAVGPLLLYANETVQHAGIAFTLDGMLHLYRSFPRNHPVIARKRYVQALTGAALMLSRTLFVSLGGFFEGYRNGCEDVELCLRLGQAGYRLALQPSSLVYHLESQSAGRKAHDEENSRLLRERVGHLLRPDYHLHALNDDFLPFVTDALDLAIRMKAEEEGALLRRLVVAPAAVRKEMIEANPLWISGRLFLAEQAEREQKYDLALLLRTDLAGLLQSREAYERLLALESFVSCADQLFSDVRTELARIETIAKSPGYTRALLEEVHKTKDTFLSALYEEKIRSLSG